MKRVDLFWSMQSAFCYLALDRALRLAARSDVALRLRPVLPGVLRMPAAYAERGPLEREYFERDAARTAAFLGLPYGPPDPSPVAFEPDSWVACARQPRIQGLYARLLAATAADQGLAFLDQVMRLIWDGRTAAWDQGDALDAAIRRAGLDPAAAAPPAAAERMLAENHAALIAAGHWGVPCFTFADEPFCGQDRIDQLLWRLGREPSR